ncbi:hypothetical protein I79_023715 [Cricetulus griseus]|uniref:Uncharacterized protein n=1 Tax=Cricetulus griseus TaxID=10029 RepID=G3IIP2_CRIGR|nr:hypothetical protein I79_023715 [Cricetulus griseus]
MWVLELNSGSQVLGNRHLNPLRSQGQHLTTYFSLDLQNSRICLWMGSNNR